MENKTFREREQNFGGLKLMFIAGFTLATFQHRQNLGWYPNDIQLHELDDNERTEIRRWAETQYEEVYLYWKNKRTTLSGRPSNQSQCHPHVRSGIEKTD